MLHLVVTEELLARHPRAAEGDVTFMRQAVVSRAACARVSRDAGLPAEMEALAPRQGSELASQVASEAVAAALAESVIGAAWLDLGAEETAAAVREAFSPELSAAFPGRRDAKSRLQELAAARRQPLAYEVVAEEGPAQAKRFTSRVLVAGAERGRGTGGSKQAAEQAAAAEALVALGEA